MTSRRVGKGSSKFEFVYTQLRRIAAGNEVHSVRWLKIRTGKTRGTGIEEKGVYWVVPCPHKSACSEEKNEQERGTRRGRRK